MLKSLFGGPLASCTPNHIVLAGLACQKCVLRSVGAPALMASVLCPYAALLAHGLPLKAIHLLAAERMDH